jgi:hypothetical protein
MYVNNPIRITSYHSITSPSSENPPENANPHDRKEQKEKKEKKEKEKAKPLAMLELIGYKELKSPHLTTIIVV